MIQPLLRFLNLEQPFEAHCDACKNNIGAILSQEGHPIAYGSLRLHEQEKNQGVYEKKLIFVIHALAPWKYYLLGATFIIYTNHQSIQYFLTQTKLLEKQMRWANFFPNIIFILLIQQESKIKYPTLYKEGQE